MNELALFAGIGGSILAGYMLGWRTVCAVEIDKFCASILMQRQNDGILRPFPIWDDVRTFDGKPWRGVVEIVTGGFPCQDISAAGSGAGLSGERSGLWKEMSRIIGEVRPEFAFVENSPNLTTRGLGKVLGDFSEMGYNTANGTFSACAFGAPHTRARMFILAHLDGQRWDKAIWAAQKTNNAKRKWQVDSHKENRCIRSEAYRCTWWETEPGVCRVDDGVSNRMDAIHALGNAQVPLVAKVAFDVLAHALFLHEISNYK